MELLKAPERGMLYALYTDRMEYRPYEREDLLLKEKDLQKNLMTISISKKFSRRKMKKRKIMHPVSRWAIIWFTMKMIC